MSGNTSKNSKLTKSAQRRLVSRTVTTATPMGTTTRLFIHVGLVAYYYYNLGVIISIPSTVPAK